MSCMTAVGRKWFFLVLTLRELRGKFFHGERVVQCFARGRVRAVQYTLHTLQLVSVLGCDGQDTSHVLAPQNKLGQVSLAQFFFAKLLNDLHGRISNSSGG